MLRQNLKDKYFSHLVRRFLSLDNGNIAKAELNARAAWRIRQGLCDAFWCLLFLVDLHVENPAISNIIQSPHQTLPDLIQPVLT
jgi:hypothetical protein